MVPRSAAGRAIVEGESGSTPISMPLSVSSAPPDERVVRLKLHKARPGSTGKPGLTLALDPASKEVIVSALAKGGAAAASASASNKSVISEISLRTLSIRPKYGPADSMSAKSEK